MKESVPFVFGVKAEGETFTGYGTSANIVRLKKSLMERDIIDYTQPNCLDISDPILKLWLKHRIWKGM